MSSQKQLYTAVAALFLMSHGACGRLGYRTIESDMDARVEAEDSGLLMVDADIGDQDAGAHDAGMIDAGFLDSGPFDAGFFDSGAFDAGFLDSGLFDAGAMDAGPADAAADAGPADGGPGDAGLMPWPPVCGDGILQPPIEECEPGTASDDGYCASNCRPCGSSSLPGFFSATTGSCYFLQSSPAIWGNAGRFCRSLSSDLVACESEAEWMAVRDGISSPLPFYTGLYWNSGWYWGATRPLVFPHWATPPPVGPGGPDYNSRSVQSGDGLWEMVSQGEFHPSVCEREPRDGWLLWNGHAYLHFEDLQSWDFARVRCQSQGGHLVTITSMEEANFLASMGLFEASVWTGLSDRSMEGQMAWITGEAVSYMEAFGSLNSDAFDCVIANNTWWYWADCTELRPSVCEIDPP